MNKTSSIQEYPVHRPANTEPNSRPLAPLQVRERVAPDLKTTFNIKSLDSSAVTVRPLYTSFGAMTTDTLLDLISSELGLDEARPAREQPGTDCCTIAAQPV